MDDGRPPSPRSPFLSGEALSAIGSWATIIAIWGYAGAPVRRHGGRRPVRPGVRAAGRAAGPLTGTVIDRLGPKATLAVARSSVSWPRWPSCGPTTSAPWPRSAAPRRHHGLLAAGAPVDAAPVGGRPPPGPHQRAGVAHRRAGHRARPGGRRGRYRRLRLPGRLRVRRPHLRARPAILPLVRCGPRPAAPPRATTRPPVGRAGPGRLAAHRPDPRCGAPWPAPSPSTCSTAWRCWPSRCTCATRSAVEEVFAALQTSFGVSWWPAACWPPGWASALPFGWVALGVGPRADGDRLPGHTLADRGLPRRGAWGVATAQISGPSARCCSGRAPSGPMGAGGADLARSSAELAGVVWPAVLVSSVGQGPHDIQAGAGGSLAHLTLTAHRLLCRVPASGERNEHGGVP